MVGDITPVLTFTYRDGVETLWFPVFKMGENLVDNSGVSFSVEGTVTNSPLLHKALDESYNHRFSNGAFDYHFKLFDVKADFVTKGEKEDEKSVLSLSYHNCRVDNYQVKTLDSNDYESYFKDVGFAVVDNVDFICSGLDTGDVHHLKSSTAGDSFTDYGESGFEFANGVRTSVTFKFGNSIEKIAFPVFNLVSGYEESGKNVVAEFQVEGVLEYYPLLYSAVDTSKSVSGLSISANPGFDALVEFTDGKSFVLRGFDFTSCRVSEAQITTKTDKEEGFTGKSGFAVVHQLTFTCSGIKGVNMHYDDIRGDAPIWETVPMTNEYVRPIQNTDQGLRIMTTFSFAGGHEVIEFSMFKQSKVLSVTEKIKDDVTFTRKVTYPTMILRGIVGDYPMLYNYLDDNRRIHGVTGTGNKELVDINIDVVSGDGDVIRGFDFVNCRAIDYTVETKPNKEESYVKNKFAVENILEFECQGYHPSNPTYDALHVVKKADTPSSFDLRNTDQWGSSFTVQD